MHGTITTFDPREGCGVIHCDNPKIDVSFCLLHVKGEKQLRVGDVVSFVGVAGLNGPEATEVNLLWQRVKTSRTTTARNIHTTKANKFNIAADLQQVAKDIAAKLPNDRDQCASCGKLMIPNMSLLNGTPHRSFCPFCGAVHRDFTTPSSPTLKHKAAEAAVGGVIGVFIGSLFGL